MTNQLLASLDGFLPSNHYLKDAWEMLKPANEMQKVASRKDAYLTFSRVLNITNGLAGDEAVRKIWRRFLEDGGIFCEETGQHYDFRTVLDLFDEGKKRFSVSWRHLNPGQNGLDREAEEINAIALEAVGLPPGADY